MTLQACPRVQFPLGTPVGDGTLMGDEVLSPATMVVTLPVMLPVKLAVGNGVNVSSVVAEKGGGGVATVVEEFADGGTPAVVFGKEGAAVTLVWMDAPEPVEKADPEGRMDVAMLLFHPGNVGPPITVGTTVPLITDGLTGAGGVSIGPGSSETVTFAGRDIVVAPAPEGVEPDPGGAVLGGAGTPVSFVEFQPPVGTGMMGVPLDAPVPMGPAVLFHDPGGPP